MCGRSSFVECQSFNIHAIMACTKSKCVQEGCCGHDTCMLYIFLLVSRIMMELFRAIGAAAVAGLKDETG